MEIALMGDMVRNQLNERNGDVTSFMDWGAWPMQRGVRCVGVERLSLVSSSNVSSSNRSQIPLKRKPGLSGPPANSAAIATSPTPLGQRSGDLAH